MKGMHTSSVAGLLSLLPVLVFGASEPLSAPVYAINEAGVQTSLWKDAASARASVYPQELILEPETHAAARRETGGGLGRAGEGV
jgi:hypothetical protein